MKDDIHRIESVSQFCQLFRFAPPTHPLITVVNIAEWAIGPEMIGKRMSPELYSIALKDKSCGMLYGRHSYDFDEGVMIFTAPGQVAVATGTQELNEIQGWMVVFHPDLIRGTALGDHMADYTFFSYDVHEALHLSLEEQRMVTEVVHNIGEEIRGRIDNHSQRVLVSSLELLLNYARRYYERQFHTRHAQHSDLVTRVNALLATQYATGQLAEQGVPTVSYLAEQVHLSPHYLGDVLRRETGRSASEHIHDFVVDKAKTLLLGTTDSVSEIAYRLGFNYPHYFSRLFRSKTGLTPTEYREQPTPSAN